MCNTCGSDPPAPPDPRTTAAVQTATNVSTAIANAYLNNQNQTTPTGNLSYTVGSTYDFVDPTSGLHYPIPIFTANQTLTEPQQNLLRLQEETQANMGTLSRDQSAMLSNVLGHPLTLSDPNLPAAGNPNRLANFTPALTSFGDTGTQQSQFGDAGAQQGTFGDAGALTRSYGPADNFSADRNRIEQGLMERLNPQLDRAQQQLRQQLADQGIRYGSPAYAAAMDDWNRQVNDARLGVIGAAGTEQQRLAGMAQQQAVFQNAAQQQLYNELQGRAELANQAQQQTYQQLLGRAQFGNQAQQNVYQQALGRANFANAGQMQIAQQQQAALNAENAARANYLQEQYTTRQEPINEITALLSGSQVQRPNFITTPQTTIPTTDVAGLINQNFQQNFSNFQAQQQAQSQLLGGLLGLGGNLALAGSISQRSDRRVKENIHRMGTVYAAGQDGDRDELPIYQYSYKDDPTSTRHIGPMAQDVEKIDPRAVGRTRGGVKTINPRMVMGSILRAA